jgi:hypothetical protein
MDKKEAIEFLKQALDEIPHLKELNHDNEDFQLWLNRVKIVCGVLSTKDVNTFLETGLPIPVVNSLTPPEVYQNLYIKRLGAYELNIKKIIEKYKLLGVETKTYALPETPPKAFIAHEGETQALNSLKEFLEALGIKYFIAESEASGGKSVEKHVNWVEEQGDFAIILATKGKAIDKKTGRYYMGLNVADELGSARQIYGNHIILLVQKGVQVHTNKKEIVYGEFTSTNMQEAFIKIARELKNWGFIRVGKVK